MQNKLEDIITNKLRELSEKKARRDFISALIKPKVRAISIIAEIKLASPTEGKLGDVINAVNNVREYEKGRADAISVVVDQKYFGGSYELLGRIRKEVSLPILAKDFVVDPYQIYEAKYFGADAVLLMAKIVSSGKLIQFVKLAQKLNLEAIVEVQTEQELNNALRTDTKIIAVNARDLDTFNVDIDLACRILNLIPREYVKLGFSGVSKRSEIEKYRKAGAKGILVGTSLMRSKNIKEFLLSLRGAKRQSHRHQAGSR